MLKIDPSRVVSLLGKINYESISKTLERIISLRHEKPEEEVFFIINSGGGSLDAGFMFIDLIKPTGVKLVTIGTGHVGSMAVPIFCTGQRRLINRHTDFFFHEVGYTPEKDQRLSLSEIKSRGEDLAKSQMWSAEFIAEQTGGQLTKQRVLDLMKSEVRMLPEDIVNSGLAHEII